LSNSDFVPSFLAWVVITACVKFLYVCALLQAELGESHREAASAASHATQLQAEVDVLSRELKQRGSAAEAASRVCTVHRFYCLSLIPAC